MEDTMRARILDKTEAFDLMKQVLELYANYKNYDDENEFGHMGKQEYQTGDVHSGISRKSTWYKQCHPVRIASTALNIIKGNELDDYTLSHIFKDGGKFDPKYAYPPMHELFHKYFDCVCVPGDNEACRVCA